jgi:hypothetical protein
VYVTRVVDEVKVFIYVLKAILRINTLNLWILKILLEFQIITRF